MRDSPAGTDRLTASWQGHNDRGPYRPANPRALPSPAGARKHAARTRGGVGTSRDGGCDPRTRAPAGEHPGAPRAHLERPAASGGKPGSTPHASSPPCISASSSLLFLVSLCRNLCPVSLSRAPPRGTRLRPARGSARQDRRGDRGPRVQGPSGGAEGEVGSDAGGEVGGGWRAGAAPRGPRLPGWELAPVLKAVARRWPGQAGVWESTFCSLETSGRERGWQRS